MKDQFLSYTPTILYTTVQTQFRYCILGALHDIPSMHKGLLMYFDTTIGSSVGIWLGCIKKYSMQT